MITKFTGKFTDLIPAGFTFHKMFAKNYIMYQWEKQKYSSESIQVWKHHGGYVEINDLGIYSALIFEAFAYKDLLQHFTKTAHDNTTYYKFVLNRTTQKLEKYDYTIHDVMYQYVLIDNGTITDEQFAENCKHIQLTYRTIPIWHNSWLYNAINTMIEKNWVTIDTSPFAIN